MLSKLHPMVQGLLERYGSTGATLLIALGLLPGDWASATCVTAGGVEISYGQMALIGGVFLANTFFGVKLNTSSSLAHASNVAAVATATTTKADIKVAEDTVKELKNTKLA